MKTTHKKKILIIAIIAVIVMLGFIFAGVAKNHKLSQQLKEKQSELSYIMEENAQLEALLSPEGESDFMESLARKAGYAYPGERIYVNESP